MMVVFAHAIEQPQIGGVHRMLRDVGWSGVDLFFVISGFVMTYTVASHSYTRKQFLLRRIARIAPLYWLMTLLTSILAITMPALFLRTRFTWDAFVASLAFVPYPNPGSGSVAPLLKLGWTLNYEMFFYLCFALMIHISPWRRSVLLGLFFATVAFISIKFQLRPSFIIFYGNPLTIEFILGCMLGTVYLQGLLARVPLLISSVVSFAGLALLVAGSVLDDQLHMREILRGIPCAMIICGCLAAERRTSFMSASLHKLGDATYSIYLTHLFVVLGLRWVALHLHLMQTEASIWFFIFVSMFVSAVVGIETHTNFERKLTKWANALLLHPKPSPI
jgi:exopolysaccharide production protein ExoZ